MINLKIDNKFIEVSEGTTVLDASKQLGIKIPTMCYLKGLTNHPSCMVCIVKEVKNDILQPSCALPVSEGMEIITNNDEIIEARKEALELLLSDHVGDCEAPCRPSCPANMNIPLMNRLIANGDFTDSIQVVKEDIALPLILGYICPAPCEKACRRTQVDEAISICSLKRFVAEKDLEIEFIQIPEKKKNTNKKIAIIGSGPAGLSCAYYLLKQGHNCVLYDKNPLPGGTLRYHIPDSKLPKSTLDFEIEIIKNYGAEFILEKDISKDYFNSNLTKNYDAIVIAMGNYYDSNLLEFGLDSNKYGLTINRETFEVTDNGIFACGNVIRSRRMAITSAAQGKATALSVHQFLMGDKPQKQKRMFNSKFGKLFDVEIDEYKKEATSDSRVKTKDHLEGFSKEQAQKEALRCMHCDCRKPDNCKLRIFADEYQADRKKFNFGERKSIKKYFQHDLIVYEPEKCIRCNMCVEISAKEKDTIGFSSIGRGFTVEINMPLDHSISELFNDTAKKCATHCPTGAISLK